MPPLVLLTAIFALGILTAYISRAGSGWVLAAFITAIILLATAAFFFFQGKGVPLSGYYHVFSVSALPLSLIHI